MKSYSTHSDVRGRDGYGFVLNVKCHSFTFADGGTDEQRERAYNNAQESWWRNAREAAQEIGFGDVYSCGRSGGYIYPTLNNGHAVTAAEIDRSQYGYGPERARHIVGMLRKFRDYVRAAMEPAALAEMFADELAHVMDSDREDAEAEAQEAPRRTAADFLAVCESQPGEFWQRLAGSVRKAQTML